MRLWFDMVTRADAKALYSWWRSHTNHYYIIMQSPTNLRFWALYRSD